MTYSDLYVEKYRPQSLDEMVIDPGIKKYFQDIFDSDKPVIPNLLFRGRPGGGKTTLAKIIRKTLGWETLVINASEESGVDTMRDKIVPFCQTMSIDGGMKLVVLEEADGLSSAGGNGSSAQELLKNLIETSSDYVRFILLVNNVSKIDAPIKSRMQEFEIVPPSLSESSSILRYVLNVIVKEGIVVNDKNDVIRLIKDNYPDIRKILQILQQCSSNEKKEFVPSAQTDSNIDEVLNGIIGGIFKGPVDDNRLMSVRAFYLENEFKFASDYRLLMRGLFERIAKNSPATPEKFNRKLDLLKTVQEYMYRDNFVLDREINFFAMLVSMVRGG